MGSEVSLVLFCCAKEELLWFLVVSAWTMSIPLVPWGRRCVLLLIRSLLVLSWAGENQQGAVFTAQLVCCGCQPEVHPCSLCVMGSLLQWAVLTNC